MKQTAHQSLHGLFDHLDLSAEHLAFFCGDARFVLHAKGTIELKNSQCSVTILSTGEVKINASHLQQESKTDILLQSGQNIHLNADKEVA